MSEAALKEARRDPEAFARLLVGQPLWPHQAEVVRSRARYRVICAGRQVGKSRLFAILALHHAFAHANSTVLVVSAGDKASKRLLEDIATLAMSSPFLAGSVVDDTSQTVVLSNGSRILSVPASTRQIRGWAVDLLIIDEAGFIDQEIWRAAEPSIIARPDSRVLLCSTPWGSAEHFFRQLWRLGMDAPDEQLASWHWPSRVSPLVDEQLLEQIRERESPLYFAREFLAEWTDDEGAYFTEAELSGAVVKYELVPPADAWQSVRDDVVAGVDWGFNRDANALTVVACRGFDDEGRKRFWLPWVEAATGVLYSDWIEHIVAASGFAGDGGYWFSSVVCELNGVGAMPSQVLASRFADLGAHGVVEPVTTSVRSKETAFGYIKLLLQQKRLDLPEHPELLKQLRGLQFEALPSGQMRIAVPERLGHDDLAMSLCLAMSAPSMLANDAPQLVEQVVGMDELFGVGWEDEDDGGWFPGMGGF